MRIEDFICPDSYIPTRQFVFGLAFAVFSGAFSVVTWFTAVGYIVWELLFIWATWDRPWLYDGLMRGALIVSIAIALFFIAKLKGYKLGGE